MTAHILFGATNPATSSLDLWASAYGGVGAIDLGVAINDDFDPVRIGAISLFIGGGANGLPQLWSTDGTVAGTLPLPLHDASGEALSITAMQAFNGGAVIAAENLVTHIHSLWFSTGTEAGMTLLASGLAASDFDVVGNTLYFAAAPDPFNATNEELYRSNGTAAGTVRVSPSGAVVAPDAYATLASGAILFENDRNSAGAVASSLWVSDGTASGTHQLTAVNLGSDAGQSDFVSLGGVALFSFAIGTAGGSALWLSDGTNAGTRQIVAAGAVLTAVSNLTVLGSEVVFTATSNGQPGLWVTDGTNAGTRRLAAYSSIGDLTAFDGKVAFSATDASGHPSLWVSDGTASGTVEISPANAASSGLNPQGLFAYFDRIGFTGTDASGHNGVWLSDGTVAGTLEAALPAAATVQTVTTGIAGSGNFVVLDGVASPYDATDGDTVSAGSGHDTVIAQTGAVQVSGGTGTLRFTGGTGFCTVSGGAGPVTVIGGAGGGIFSGGAAGSNVLVAGGGNTTLVGGGASDALFGAATGQTNLVAAYGRESMIGGGGASNFWGGSHGGAVVFTGNGPSTVTAGGSGGDTVVGGGGTLLVNAQHGEAVFTGSGAATVNGSSQGADSIIGGAGSLVVNAAGANMIVVGGSGPSAIATSTGYALIFQGGGNMQVTSGGGPLQVVAGRGGGSIGVGAGGITLDIVNGAAGGLDVIAGFRPKSDHIDLFGFNAGDVHTHVQNGSVTISLSDGSQVTLLGVTDPGAGLVLV